MKLKGKIVKGRNREIVVIPRSSGENLVFIAEAVEGYEPVDKILKEPQPPKKKRPGNEIVEDHSDTGYQLQLRLHQRKRMAWMILKSLEATPDLEWETVQMNNPDTWLNWEKELKEADLNQFEINRIINGVFAANCLNETLVEAARESFLLGMAAGQGKSSGQNTEQASSPSGEPV